MAFTPREIATKRVLDTQIRHEAVLGDPMYAFMGKVNYTPEMASVEPGAAVARLSGGDTVKKVLNMHRPLLGTGVVGRESAKGKEESQRTVELVVEANSWGHAVSTEKYGVDFVRQQALKVYQQEKPQLSRWYSQMCGYKLRQAAIEVKSAEQLAAPTSASLGLNRNFQVSGTLAPVQYSGTLSTFRGNIATAASSVADLTLDRLGLIQETTTTNLLINPLSKNGWTGYVMYVPPHVFRKFYNDFRGEFKYDAAQEIIKGIKDAVVYNGIMIVADPRAAILNINAGTHTYIYKGAGGVPTTTVGGGTNYGVGLLFGEGAVIEFENEAIHFEEDVTDYNRNRGVGIFATQSWTLAQYYEDGVAASPSNIVNNSSSVVLFPGS